jgi:hypothetical protein
LITSLLVAFAPGGEVARPARAGSPDQSGMSACALSGYTADPDPAGTNVRAAPRRDAPIVGKLPPPADDAEQQAPEFDIVGSRDGWFLMRNARQSGDKRRLKAIFSGSGWVAGNLVRFTINDPHLRAAPQDDAPELLHLSGERDEGAWGPDSVEILHAHGCSGRFAEVTVKTPDGKTGRGWVTRICSNQLTTCP